MGRPKQFDLEIKTAITERDLAALQRLARSDNVPVAELVRHAIKSYLAERFEEAS